MHRSSSYASLRCLQPLALSLLALLGVACSKEASEPTPPQNGLPVVTTTTLQLDWFPEAEHGGFYAAHVHNLYTEHGLRVDIRPGGPNAPVLTQVAAGQVDFGLAGADNILLGRAEGTQVVALMASMQDSPQCIMVHEKSGITQLKDLANLTLAAEIRLPYVQFLKKNVPLTGVQLVPYTGSVAEFLVKDTYAQQAYAISEPYVAKSKGGDPRCLMISELGFNPYSTVLITRKELLEQKPELVKRMVNASIAGWKKYLEAPEETHKFINTLNPAMDVQALAFGAEQLKTLVPGTQGTGIGHLSPERWQTLVSQLESLQLLQPGKVKAEEAYDTRFLPSAPVLPAAAPAPASAATDSAPAPAPAPALAAPAAAPAAAGSTP